MLARLAAALLSAALMLLALTVPATAQDPAPTLEEIPYGVGIQGHPLWDSWFDPAPFGYEQHEYLITGTATATGSTDTADYTTRFIVTRPSDPADFAGTVMLDWVNVTAQFENAVNSLASVEFLLREGWAYVHVSAQSAGVCCSPLTPKVWDPVRYAALDHPGDDYAKDIFTQVARAIRSPGAVDPMGGLDVEVLIAAGQSQGANRLTEYVKLHQADAGVIDAFLIQAEGDKVHEVAPAAPMIHLLGEREGDPEEPTPWPTYRLWEVAGGAHADAWIGRQQTEGQGQRLATGLQRTREQAEALWADAGSFGEQPDARSTACIVNGAQFPTRYPTNAALAALDGWVRDGTVPPNSPRYDFDDGGDVARDADGNALGGLRIPPIVHPVARYRSDDCNLGGTTIPFTEPELLQRYGDHATWYAQMVDATRTSIADGYLLREDAQDLLARACGARLRFLDPSSGPCEPALDTATTDPATPAPTPAPTAAPDTGALPATGGGIAMAGLLALVAAALARAATGAPA